jgi:hypothetical protein
MYRNGTIEKYPHRLCDVSLYEIGGNPFVSKLIAGDMTMSCFKKFCLKSDYCVPFSASERLKSESLESEYQMPRR